MRLPSPVSSWVLKLNCFIQFIKAIMLLIASKWSFVLRPTDAFPCAVADACRQLNERLEPFREKMPDASFREIVNAAYFERVDLSAHGFYKTPDVTGFGGTLPFNYFTFGASCSEVELDTLTGRLDNSTEFSACQCIHCLRYTKIKHTCNKNLQPWVEIRFQFRPSFLLQNAACSPMSPTLSFLTSLSKATSNSPMHHKTWSISKQNLSNLANSDHNLLQHGWHRSFIAND